MPGDPMYGFMQVKDGDGHPVIPDSLVQTLDPETLPGLLALAAKGNIIVGDYTSAAFKLQVLPKVRPFSKDDNPTSKVQSYEVDPSDRSLGYHTDGPEEHPIFNGDYDEQDQELVNPDEPDGPLQPGRKVDDTERRFYESTMKDSEFQDLVRHRPTDAQPWGMPEGNRGMTIDAVLYTNHALAGLDPSDGLLELNGAFVSRDDALIWNGPFRINHDVRLMDPRTARLIVLPISLRRPAVVRFQECPESGCI
jgi:hypothetical protein